MQSHFSAFPHICPTSQSKEVGSDNLDRVYRVGKFLYAVNSNHVANCSSLAKICNTSYNEAIISEFRDSFIGMRAAYSLRHRPLRYNITVDENAHIHGSYTWHSAHLSDCNFITHTCSVKHLLGLEKF